MNTSKCQSPICLNTPPPPGNHHTIDTMLMLLPMRSTLPTILAVSGAHTMGQILRDSCWRPSLSMESQMQSSRSPQFPFSFTKSRPDSSTEIAVANALKTSAADVGIHFGQSMNRRALTKWATVRILSSESSSKSLTISQLGHSAVDVNLIGYATRQAVTNLERIRGNHDNTGAASLHPYLRIVLSLFQRSDYSSPMNCS